MIIWRRVIKPDREVGCETLNLYYISKRLGVFLPKNAWFIVGNGDEVPSECHRQERARSKTAIDMSWIDSLCLYPEKSPV